MREMSRWLTLGEYVLGTILGRVPKGPAEDRTGLVSIAQVMPSVVVEIVKIFAKIPYLQHYYDSGSLDQEQGFRIVRPVKSWG